MRLDSLLKVNILFKAIVLAILMFEIVAPLMAAEVHKIDNIPVKVEKIVSNLNMPWGITFLTSCKLLITERDGNLILADINGNKQQVLGVPEVQNDGQGGLLDIEVAKDFTRTRELFFTYAGRISQNKIGTVLGVAELSINNQSLQNVRSLFSMSEGSFNTRHFGSRVVEGEDGHLFVTIGDRGDRPSAQKLNTHNGSIIRVARDGSIPTDNPFINKANSLPEIWSYGHRNPQGAALDSRGNLWISEHGARGGDEINLIAPGLNYGWPVISYGVHYSGRKIGEGIAKQGMEQPEFFWDPSMAPSGMTIYSGKLWPEWKDQIFLGSLKFDYISRLSTIDVVDEIEKIEFPETKRVRDIQEAPDGTLWFASEDRHAIYRIAPMDWHSHSQKSCLF